MIRPFLVVIWSCTILAGCQKSPASADANAGKAVYDKHCATCHGPGGDVRQAEQHDPKTPDLRTVAERSPGGRMPRVMLAETIDGRRILRAHGGRSMPVWGNELGSAGGASAEEKIEALMAYIESIQTQ